MNVITPNKSAFERCPRKTKHTDLLPGLCVRKAENVIWKGENKKLKDPIRCRILFRCLNWKRAASFWFYFKYITRCFASQNMSYQISGHQRDTQRGAESHTAENGKCMVTALLLSDIGWSCMGDQLWLHTLKCSTKHMHLPASDREIALVSLTPRFWSD